VMCAPSTRDGDRFRRKFAIIITGLLVSQQHINMWDIASFPVGKEFTSTILESTLTDFFRAIATTGEGTLHSVALCSNFLH